MQITTPATIDDSDHVDDEDTRKRAPLIRYKRVDLAIVWKPANQLAERI